MDAEFAKKIKTLHGQIEERIGGEKVKFDGKQISLYDFNEAMKKGFYKYNVILFNELNRIKKIMNKKIALSNGFRKKVPYIANIVPTIYEDGEKELSIQFEVAGKCKGIATIAEDMSITFEFLNPEYNIGTTQKFLHIFDPTFVSCMHALNTFSQEYPETAYSWDMNNDDENVQHIDDGFMQAKVDLNHLDRTHAYLSSIEDLSLSRCRTYEYGELNDYVEFYNKDIQKRVRVDIDSLDPLFKGILSKSYKCIGGYTKSNPTRKMTREQ